MFLPTTILNAEISFNFIIAVISMTLGVCGYVGLLLLLKGFHKTNHKLKIKLLFGGLLGFVLFIFFVSPRNIVDWLIEFNLESTLGKWPLIVSLTFLILTSLDLRNLIIEPTN
tara:strand:+ start:370 stop:708 length:339 start_codon:yes stop_codon:yes gene_type:complete